jgi:hypothetical protein
MGFQSSALRAHNSSTQSPAYERSAKRRRMAVCNAVLPLEKRVLFTVTPFQPGDFVVYQVGTTGSTTALSAVSVPVYLDEYTPSGTLIQQIPMNSGMNPLSAAGSGTTEGYLTTSQNGQTLLVPGYNAPSGVSNIASTLATTATTTGTVTVGAPAASPVILTVNSTTGMVSGQAITISGVTSVPNGTYYLQLQSTSTKIALYSNSTLTTPVTTTTVGTAGTWSDPSINIAQREIGVVSPTGSIDTSTTLGTSISGNAIRGAASVTGATSTGVYAAGANGFFYSSVDSTANAVSLNGSTGRTLMINNNQLYFDTSSLLGTLGSGLPTVTGQVGTDLPGVSNTSIPAQGIGGPYQFAFATLGGGSSADTIYVADNYNYGVDKYSLEGSTWTLTGELGGGSSSTTNPISNVLGIAVEAVPTGEELFMTTGTGIYSYIDTSGYEGSLPTPTNGTNVSTASLVTAVLAPTSNTAGVNFRGVALVPQPAALSMFQQPSAVTVPAGNTASFTSLAYGANASVQWQVNMGSGFVNVANNANYQGATTTTLNVLNTTLSESGYQYRAVFTNTSGTLNSNLATLIVNSVPTLSFDSSTYTVNENASPATVTIYVDRGGNTTGSVSVNYSTGSLTAISGTNFTSESGTLTFPAGTTGASIQQSITVPITAQYTASGGPGNLTFNLTLSGATASGAITTPATTTVTIVDTQELFALSNPTFTANDTQGDAEITVTRSVYLNDAATIGYNTSDGTAVAGSGDYTSENGTLSFAINQSSATITVPIGTITGAATKNFNISIGAPFSGSGVGTFNTSASTSTVTIVDTSGAAFTNNLSGTAATGSTNIETGSNYTSSFAPVNGDSNIANGTFAYVGYQLFLFTKALSPGIYPVSGSTVNTGGISNITLELNNANNSYGATGPHPGNFDVYFINDTTTPSTSLTYNASTGTGLAAAQFNASYGSGAGYTGAPILLGSYSFTDNSNGYDATTLGISGSSSVPIPASVQAALVADLNAGTSFRLAVTPASTGIGAMAADWYNVDAPYTATLNVSAGITVNTQTEYFNLSSPSYTVHENVSTGVATITVTRYGANISDGAMITYSTSDDTAIAGTNYTGVTNGTANFSAGSATASFNVSIANITPQGGDKIFTVTLNGALTGANSSGATVGVLGSQTTATVTIDDNNDSIYPYAHETLSGYASDASTIEIKNSTSAADIYNSAFEVEGSGGTYSGFGAADFNNASTAGPIPISGTVNDPGDDGIIPTGTVTAINSISLTVFAAASGTTGPVNIYLVTDSTDNILSTGSPASPFAYNVSAAPEGVGAQFGATYLLGSFTWSGSTPANTFVSIPLNNFTQATENILTSDLNSGTPFRIVAAAENTAVLADWANKSTVYNGTQTAYDGQYEIPQLTFGVQESLPSWLAPTSQALYNATTKALTVTGPTTIIADPGSAAPIITSNGSSAILSVNVSSSTAIHVGAITLANGSSMTVSTSSGTPSLLLDAGGVSIDGTSTLNITNNFFDVQGSNLGTVSTLVGQGFNNGLWTGNGGITSSVASSDTHHLKGVGAIQNSNAAGGTFYPTIDGAALGSSDVLVRATYYGDANLDGKVDGSDYSLIDYSYLQEHWVNGAETNSPVTGWYNGDFNYDNNVDGSDYTLIDNAFNTQGTQLAMPQDLIASSSKTKTGKNTAVSTTATPPTPTTDSFFSKKKVSSSLISDIEDLITTK